MRILKVTRSGTISGMLTDVEAKSIRMRILKVDPGWLLPLNYLVEAKSIRMRILKGGGGAQAVGGGAQG